MTRRKNLFGYGSLKRNMIAVYRYPDEFFETEPDAHQMEEALDLSQRILDFVLEKLPSDVHP